jgi:hypothetical protein
MAGSRHEPVSRSRCARSVSWLGLSDPFDTLLGEVMIDGIFHADPG